MPGPVANPPDGATPIEVERWKMAYKKQLEQTEVYQNFLAGLFNLLLGQCTEIMKDKLQARAEYDEINRAQNGVELLALIKQITFTYDDNRRYEVEARDDFKAKFFALKRERHQSIADFYRLFKGHVNACCEVGVTLYDDLTLQEVAAANYRDVPNEQDRAAAQEKATAMRFIRACGNSGYEAHLKNKYLDGENAFPVTLADARAIMEQRTEQNSGNVIHDSNTGIAFVTGGRDAQGNRVCFRCGSRDHMVAECPKPDMRVTESKDGGGENVIHQTSNAESIKQVSHVLSVTQGAVRNRIPPNWILLDNQATVDIFCNGDLVDNIHDVNQGMTIIGTTGARTTTKRAVLPGYGDVWYDKDNAANILSMGNMKKKYRIIHDSDDGDTFRVHDRSTGSVVMEFVPTEDGLYYFDTSRWHGSAFVTTVSTNKSRYTTQDVIRATNVRKLQRAVGRPNTRDFIRIIEQHAIPNCPFNRADVMAAEDIFGPDLGSLKGKTTRRKPLKVETEISSTMLDQNVMRRYRSLTLCADVMHVNGVPMLVTKTRNLHFGTVDVLPGLTSKHIVDSIGGTISLYKHAGFNITTAMMDGAFEPLRGYLWSRGVVLNTTSRDEHVGDIERYIRTVKERMRSAYNALPFKKMPRIMVMELAKHAVYWLNSFPHKDGISEHLSPREIMTGEQIDYNRHCKYEFGDYVQTHEPHDNTMAARTTGAIALRPTGNRQGSFYFMSLVTGRVINRNHATSLPMPAEVIDAVDRLAASQEAEPGLAFGNRDNRILFSEIEDDEDDEYSYDESADEDLLYDEEIDEEEKGDDLSNGPVEDTQIGPADETNDEPNREERADSPLEAEDGEGPSEPPLETAEPIPDKDIIEDTICPEEHVGNAAENHRSGADRETGVNCNELAPAQDMDRLYGPRSGRYNLRERRHPEYGYRYGFDSGEGAAMVTEQRLGTMSTPQMGLKAGLQMFGQPGDDAVKKELRQLHDRKVIEPRKKHEVNEEQMRNALSYLMFLKRKRCGQIKARGCADGRKQRAYIDRADASSPTVATESVFITAMIDAAEHRCVGIVDVPGAFMQAEDNDGTIMRIDGRMAEMLMEIDHEAYAPYITSESDRPVLYVELKRALYGTLKAARLFWEKLSSKLQEWGFDMNPYDSCVANKIINDKQCTVAWHVDDIKISHTDDKVVDQVIALLEQEFGQEDELTKSYGKLHDYLGMDLDFSEPGVLTISMENYIKTILKDVPRDMIGRARNPAGKHLFKVNMVDPVKLNDKDSEVFHHITMQLMYLSQRARPDIRLAVSFLSSRVQSPDEDDYKKLCRVMRYLQATLDLPLRLVCDGSGVVRWWVDAAYTVHSDMKGHTGATMSLGSGSAYSSSTKQKIVTRSSTECELVGVHDVMPQILWTRNFLIAQGYQVSDTVVYQDNKSAILLENNGRMSSSKRTKHIEVRYFYIKDRVNQQDIRIEYCPTTKMTSDFFTKPTQGSLFLRQRDQIMHIDPSSNYHSAHRSVLEKPGCTGAAGTVGDGQNGLYPVVEAGGMSRAEQIDEQKVQVTKKDQG